MKLDELIAQLFLITISICAGIIAYQFYRSKDGRLRILIIELFISKVWVYGGAAIYYLLLHYKIDVGVSASVVRIILNLPMFVVMLRLYSYIRLKQRNE